MNEKTIALRLGGRATKPSGFIALWPKARGTCPRHRLGAVMIPPEVVSQHHPPKLAPGTFFGVPKKCLARIRGPIERGVEMLAKLSSSEGSDGSDGADGAIKKDQIPSGGYLVF